jgi:hypothetical protein
MAKRMLKGYKTDIHIYTYIYIYINKSKHIDNKRTNSKRASDYSEKDGVAGLKKKHGRQQNYSETDQNC